jgi:uncharacterized membrane protein
MVQTLTTDKERKAVIAAIGAAEAGNCGEVCVHLEKKCPLDDVLARAEQLFGRLQMHDTKDDTGVLLYVAVDDRKVAVYAGKGIHGAAADGFWQDVASAVATGFKSGAPLVGLRDALERIGDLLREHVPGSDDAGDELPNQVTTS